MCKDEYNHCPVFALRGDCKLNPHYMLQKCMRSCNLCGDLVEQKDRIQPTSKKTLIRRPSPYVTSPIQTSPITTRTTTTPSTTSKSRVNLDSCKDLVDYCRELADRGDCVTNAATMKYYCPRSCRAC